MTNSKGRTDALTYDDELILIKSTPVIGSRGETTGQAETKTHVLCNVRSLTRTETETARQSKLNPAYVFIINGFEYDGQREAEFEGRRYAIDSTYMLGRDELELKCVEKTGVAYGK